MKIVLFSQFGTRRKWVMYSGALWILLIFLRSTKSTKIEVTTDRGKVIGTQVATVFGRKLFYGFYGIPYAQPPVNKLRFKNPKRPIKWDRPYDARTEFHGACTQLHVTLPKGIYGVEDCLRLNVYTPALGNPGSKLKAVIVWIHGHAFTSSFSHLHGGDFFIENDVVVVTVTHRIGAFGFLKLNDSDTHTNMGLRDIVMALRWVKRNIKQFSGDKNNVTIMGSSSGAIYLSMLLMSKYRQLFAKMILQSGGMFSPALFQMDAGTERQRLMKELAKITTKDLMTASAKDIIYASLKIQNSLDVINSQRPIIPFSPIIEPAGKKAIITQTPKEFFKNTGTVNISKPLLIGFTTQESLADSVQFLQNPYYLKLFNSHFKYMVPFSDGCKYNYSSKTYQDVSRTIKIKYFKDTITEKSIDDFLTYSSHLRKYPIYEFIKEYSLVSNAKNFVYKFNYVGNFNVVRSIVSAGTTLQIKGTASGDEVCYLFKCEPYWESYIRTGNDTNSQDRKFIDQYTQLWANFAKTGDPTPISYHGSVTWLPMTNDKHNIMVIGKVNKVTDAKVEEAMFRFWKKVYNDYYSIEHCDGKKRDEL